MKLGKLLDKVLLAISRRPNSIDVISSFTAVIFGLLFGFIVMLIINPGAAPQGLATIIFGPFQRGMRGIGDTIFYAVPIIFTGLSVAFAFRTGLFNIGAAGQMFIGSFVAVYIGINWGFLGPFHWPVAVLGAMLAGGVWGAIPGLLKAFRNVHEVVSSIMLNYVAVHLVSILIRSQIYDSARGRAYSVESTSHMPTWFLSDIFPRSSINIGFFLAILAVIIVHIVLNRTAFGYELKSVGFNRDAARYAGMNEKRNIILSFTIAGLLSGIAGALVYLRPGISMATAEVPPEAGFTGIAIALLGLSAPVGVLVAGLFYGLIDRGGYFAQSLFREEIVSIIIAVIIYFSALSLFTKHLIAKFIRRRVKRDVELQESKGEIK